MDMNFENIMEMIITYGMKVIAIIILLIIGFKVIKSIVKRIDKSMAKKDVDPTVRNFVTSLSNIAFKVMLIIGIAMTLGYDATSFVAVLGAVSFAVGMALQGTLGNFAAGVVLLILRPIRIGDFVEAAGMTGSVKAIHVFSTELKTPDNKTIIIPNGNIIGSNIVNYSIEPQRRVDFTFGVEYDADIKQVKDLLYKVASSHDKVLKDPDVFVGLSELADSSINFALRVWVNAEDYWRVFFDLNEQIKNELDAAKIGIPYPHIQVVND